MDPNALSSSPALIAGLVGQFVAQTALYFVVVSAAFVIVWRWGAARFAGRRVQKTRRADAKQIRFEVKHTVVTMVVGTLNAALLIGLTSAGLTQVQMGAEGWAAWELALVVVGLVFLNDVWFYAWHRALHRPWLFKHVHAIHHRSIDTTPFTSYSFHAVEALIFGGWLIPAALLVPLPVPALVVTAAIGLANNVMSHLGYEFLPTWLLKVPGLRWANTATFHSLHHARSHGNYGLFTRVWDRLFGTELEGYEQAFLDRTPPLAPAVATPSVATEAA
jgi:sterol desaturase/sphingolipid hydroxylase (fatty acid hydroxylase superfamily)